MLLPVAGALIIGFPALLLGLWFSWFTRQRWLRGGAISVAKAWVVYPFLIAGILTAVSAPLVHTNFGLMYNAFACFCIFAIAGGIPSAVIALVVSSLSYWLRHLANEYESTTAFIMVLATFSGILAGLPAIKLSMEVMDTFW